MGCNCGKKSKANKAKFLNNQSSPTKVKPIAKDYTTEAIARIKRNK